MPKTIETDRVARALRIYREMRRDRTTNYIVKSHVWKLAYWRARVEAA